MFLIRMMQAKPLMVDKVIKVGFAKGNATALISNKAKNSDKTEDN